MINSLGTLAKQIRTGTAAAALLACVLTAALPTKANAETQIRYQEVVRSILYMPMYVALNQGYFKDQGLDVSLKTSQGTDKGMAALLSGGADIVLIGPEASVYVNNSESPVKTRMFAGLTATDGFLLMAKNPTTPFDWNSLRGKKIMSFRQGSNPDVFLATALEKHGIDPDKDVKIVSNIGPAARAGAWMADQTDFAIFLEPEASNMEAAGKGKVVASMGKEVGQVDFTAFTTTDTYIKSHPEVLSAWTRAIYRAQKQIQTVPAATLASQIQSYFPGVSQAELIKAIERYRPLHLWKQNPLIEPAAMEKLQDMLIDRHLLKPEQRLAYEKLVDPHFAQEVMK